MVIMHQAEYIQTPILNLKLPNQTIKQYRFKFLLLLPYTLFLFFLALDLLSKFIESLIFYEEIIKNVKNTYDYKGKAYKQQNLEENIRKYIAKNPKFNFSAFGYIKHTFVN